MAWLRGEGPATHLQQHTAPVNVPVYVAAITSRTVEHAAEIADGIMPIFWSPERVRRSKAALSNELLDSICLMGPIDRCQQRLAEYRSAGVDMPILMAPLGVEGARNVIAAFRRPVAGSVERTERAVAAQPA